MKFSLNKEEKLFLKDKYARLGIPGFSAKQKINEINSINHKLTLESNKKNKSKESIKEQMLKELGI